MRESIVMKVRNIHCDTTEMADAWSIHDKGPNSIIKCVVHAHAQTPCARGKKAESCHYVRLLCRFALSLHFLAL